MDSIQQAHYARGAATYDQDFGDTPEHGLSLYVLLGLLDCVKAESLLDVGAGTGRALSFLMEHRPKLMVRGIEPVAELRDQASRKGIPDEWLVAGDAYMLPYPDDSFDIVTEFGVLHHVKNPSLVVNEMLRVARYGILLSDTNNLGQGRLAGRVIKNVFWWLGLWGVFNFTRTRGRGYVYEPWDGLWYYYSVFSHFSDLRCRCHSVHVLNTRKPSMTPWFSASHAMIFATKSAATKGNGLFEHLGRL